MSLLKALRDSYDIEDAVLKDLGLRDYTIYMRTTAYQGADLPHGIKGTATITDTEIIPTPRIRMVSLQLVAKSNGFVQEGDLMIYISGNISKSLLEQADGLVYNNTLWKTINIDADPDISMPLQWKVLVRKESHG